MTQNSIHVTALQREARRVARARAGYLATLAAPAGALHVVALPMLGRLQGVGHDVLMPGANVTAHAPGSCARRLN